MRLQPLTQMEELHLRLSPTVIRHLLILTSIIYHIISHVPLTVFSCYCVVTLLFPLL